MRHTHATIARDTATFLQAGGTITILDSSNEVTGVKSVDDSPISAEFIEADEEPVC